MSHPYEPQPDIVPSPYHQSFWAGLGNYTRGSLDPTFDTAPLVDEALGDFNLSSECSKLKAEALAGIRAGIASLGLGSMLTDMAMGIITSNFTQLAEKAITAGPEAAVSWVLGKIPGGGALGAVKSMVVPLINAQMGKLKQCVNVKMSDGTGFKDPLQALRETMQQEQQKQQGMQYNLGLIKAVAPPKFVAIDGTRLAYTPPTAPPALPKAPTATAGSNKKMLVLGLGAAALAAFLLF
jgi:hypothetical protein